MAMVTYPLNNVQYNAEDAELYNAVRMSGVWSGSAFDAEVAGNDTIVTIGEGLAWIANTKFSGKVVAQKEPIALDLGTADPYYNRIDVIAIQFDSVENKTDLVVKKGIATSGPEIPARSTTESLYELYLYSILRTAGSSVVSKSNITDLRDDREFCGYMQDSIKPGYAPSLMEHNDGKDFRFWVGTEEQYEEQKDSLKENTFCIINDDKSYLESSDFPGCYYRVVNGALEWYNPPMEEGVEYRTTERFEGNPVYKTYKSLESLPNAGTTRVEFGRQGETFDKIVKLTAVGFNAEGLLYPFPIISAENEILGYARMGGNKTVYIRTFSDLSAFKGRFVLEYTK